MKVKGIAIEPAEVLIEDIAYRPCDVAVVFLEIVKIDEMPGQRDCCGEFLRGHACVHALYSFLKDMLQSFTIMSENLSYVFPAEKRVGMPRSQHFGFKHCCEPETGTPRGDVPAACSPHGVDVGEGTIQIVAAEDYFFFRKPYGKRIAGFAGGCEEPQFHSGHGERHAVAAEKMVGRNGSRLSAENSSSGAGIAYRGYTVADAFFWRKQKAALFCTTGFEQRHKVGVFEGLCFSAEVMAGPYIGFCSL